MSKNGKSLGHAGVWFTWEELDMLSTVAELSGKTVFKFVHDAAVKEAGQKILEHSAKFFAALE